MPPPNPSASDRDPTPTPTLAVITVQSEITRVLAINVLGFIVITGGTIRGLLVPHDPGFAWYWLLVPASGFLIAAFFINFLRRLAREGRGIPAWLWISNVVFESLIPTAAIAALWLGGTLRAGIAITSPAVMAYAVVLILAPLRLRPGACILAGALAAIGHMSLVAATAAERHAHPQSTSPASVLYMYAVWLMIGGLAAAFVAHQLRAHVRRVLSEARLRQHAEREISVAAEIQQGLLPKSPPEFDGFDLAFFNRPADKTGGDYYDWQLLPDGRLAVSLADVTGHGLGPALMAAFCRAYARATLDGEPGLSAAMRRVNTMLSADLPPGRFVTFVVALLTRNNPRLELLSAGHGPILVHRAQTGAVESHNATSVPLGVQPDDPFDGVATITLAEGDGLVLLTDGFFEWANASGEQFGLQRLREALARTPRESVAVIDTLRAQVEAFAGGTTQTDDLSAVVVRFRGTS